MKSCALCSLGYSQACIDTRVANKKCTKVYPLNLKAFIGSDYGNVAEALAKHSNIEGSVVCYGSYDELVFLWDWPVGIPVVVVGIDRVPGRRTTGKGKDAFRPGPASGLIRAMGIKHPHTPLWRGWDTPNQREPKVPRTQSVLPICLTGMLAPVDSLGVGTGPF
ncbi:hypothetical protein WN48_02871 [Eufriesea mexicana]|uniref:Uncharacterized protein n=1 Tax=Eufriesea mexicana TaxID=516756 RepID=A0A310STT5_9HYME|nr:hypothetical protein WN48_02871 [Eufriesea mexicana]